MAVDKKEGQLETIITSFTGTGPTAQTPCDAEGR
jgi:hypothetical protein